MSIVRNFNLYLNAGNGSAPYINVNQYDQGEQWVFTLYKEDGTKYTPSTGAIVGIKADNRGIINTGTVDADGRVVINETQQMTAAAGIAIFELLIDGDTHGTANFLVNVEQRPGDNADLSDSDLSLIQQAVDSAEVIVEVIGDSDPSEVIGEHVDDWLDNHPEATTTVQDGAITAPKINNSLWDKILVNEEVSGNPASFEDGADDVPVSSLKVNLEPIQTGTGDPSPTNIRPISGHSSVTVERTGKNLLDASTFVNKAWNGDGAFATRARPTNAIIVPVGSVITVSVSSDFLSKYVYAVLQMDKDFPASSTVGDSGWRSVAVTTVTMASQHLGINIKRIDNGNVDLTDLQSTKIQVEYGNTATAYVPFVEGASYPYTLGQTVYGGTVDLATGVLTVDKVAVDLGTFTWTAQTDSQGQYFRTGLTPQGRVSLTENICSCYSVVSSANVGDGNIAMGQAGNVMYVRDTRFTDAATFKTEITGQMFVYLLATPQTIQLTPQEVKTLLGYNNISSSGTVDVIYHADTKLYVDKMTNVDNAIIAPTEEGFTATRNYTVNDLVIVNDTLYKVTANIASGSTITPNSNVTQTTLSALIKALS